MHILGQAPTTRCKTKRLASLAVVAWLAFVPAPYTHALQDAADNGEALIELGLPPEVQLSLLIQMVSEELGLQVMSDDRVGNQRVRLLIPGPIPRESLRGVLESALRMRGLALVPGSEPGWLQVVQAQNLLDFAGQITDGNEDTAPSAILTRVFQLEHADAQRAEQVVTPLLTQPGGNILRVGEQRMLIITDYASNIGRIEEMIGLIDRPPHEIATRFRQIVNLDAQQAADELQRILQAQQRAHGHGAQGRVAETGIQIVRRERTNELVLLGPPGQVDAAFALLDAIDIPLGLETRIYRFRTASPQRVAGLVGNLIDDVSRERFFRSDADEDNGLLVVTTTPAIHEQVAAIQRDLDREIEATQPVVAYYKLLNAKAEDVFATLAEMQGLVAPLSVSADGVAGQADRPSPPQDRPESAPAVLVDPTLPDRRLDPRDRLGNLGPLRETAPAAAGVQADDAAIVINPGTNTLIITAPEERQAFYADIIKQLDRRRPQVMIEVTLVALSVSDGSSVGVEISHFGDDDDEPRVISFSNFGLTDSAGAPPAMLNAALGFNGAIISEDIANVVIRALQTDGRTEVVSSPKILVNDNASGTLTSVTDAPFASINASSTVSSTSFGGFESAGTTIQVTPQISEGNHLRLTYSIELSTFGEGGSDTTPPPRQRQQISSEVTVPDRHTVIVGGLKRHDLTESASRLPLIGKLPWLEYLFSSQGHNESEATLFVFIRPVVLRDDTFEGLKYLSSRDLNNAGLPQDYPSSNPLLMH